MKASLSLSLTCSHNFPSLCRFVSLRRFLETKEKIEMAPRGRKRKIGLRREDAARDRMKELGFDKRVINESIKQVLEVYDEDNWFLIEDNNYEALFTTCIEKQKELDNKLAAEKQEEMAREEQDEEKEADALSITNEPVMDSSPPPLQFVEAPVDYAHHSVGGAESSHCGWLSSSEEEIDPDEGSDGDDDDMIQLTPEPLCEELQELVRQVNERMKMKYN